MFCFVPCNLNHFRSGIDPIYLGGFPNITFGAQGKVAAAAAYIENLISLSDLYHLDDHPTVRVIDSQTHQAGVNMVLRCFMDRGTISLRTIPLFGTSVHYMHAGHPVAALSACIIRNL